MNFILVSKYFSRVRGMYHTHVRNKNKEARFLVLIFFTLTFITARFIVYGITYHFLPSFPFSYIFYKEVHIHHLVFGILLLLIAGFIRIPAQNNNLVRISSILYGIGAALTLDEFAIWLRLNPHAYFGPEGRISIDAVVIFTLLILLTLWYGNFLKRILLFTVAFVHNRKKKKLRKINPRPQKEKNVHMRHILLYVALGLFTFFTIILILPSPTFFSHRASTQQILTNAIINGQELQNTTETSSASALLTPSLVISTTPTATPAPQPATPSADFCLTVPVLMYHHVQPIVIAQTRGQLSLTVDTSVFDQQMQYLVTHGYKTISAEDLVIALRNHTYLPPTDVVVTLDDAYEDNYTDAFPIAKKYHVILNIMVPTGLLGTHPVNTDNYYFSWQELKEMVNSGYINAYDHTWSHYPVGTGDITKNQFEIMTPKAQLEQNLGKTEDLFTYPYGSGQDMAWIEDLLQKDGFIGAYSTIGGTEQCTSFIMSLHRNHVGSDYFPGFGIN